MAGSNSIIQEVRRRLLAIAEGGDNGHDGAFVYTPGAVLIGPTIIDATVATYPVYNILRGAHDAAPSVGGNAAINELTVSVGIRMPITRPDDIADFNPYLPFENCIADIKAALFDRRTRPFRDPAGNVLAAVWYADASEINIDAEDRVSDASVTLVAVLSSGSSSFF